MARYFFDIHDDRLTLDEVGVECDDLEGARREARRALPDMARDVLTEDGDRLRMSIVVRDESNETVYSATLVFQGDPARPSDESRAV